MTENEIKLLQAYLNTKGFALNEDGKWGVDTAAAFDSVFKPSITAVNPTQILGLDVYHEDNVTNWSAIAGAGMRKFVYIKASQGLSADPKFSTYTEAAQAAGLIVGAYHFISLLGDPTEQARFFCGILKNNDYDPELDLPPVLDWEYEDGVNPKPSDSSWAIIFLAAVKATLGVRPMIYMSASLPDAIGNPAWLTSYPLWVAEYGVSAPKLRAPYTTWQFWQNSEDAVIPGLGNTGDSNIFNGTIEDLAAFKAASKP